MTKRRGWTYNFEPEKEEPKKIGYLNYPQEPDADNVGQLLGPDMNRGWHVVSAIDGRRVALTQVHVGQARKTHAYRPTKLWVRAR